MVDNTRNSVNGDNRHRYRAPYGPITLGSSTGATRRISTFVLPIPIQSPLSYQLHPDQLDQLDHIHQLD
jgi:hypothetical protein